MSKTIAFFKFKALLELELRSFWHLLTSLEYAERWLSSLPSQPHRLDLYPGDQGYPFCSISIPPSEFVDEKPMVKSFVHENALVNFVTTFECYLFDLMERLIYVDPNLINDSDIPITAKEIVTIPPSLDTRRWLATKVSNKYLRNKTHSEMIAKLGKLTKSGVSSQLATEIEEWNKWSLVRNSIVHTSRYVTTELSTSWPQRFPTAGAPLNLNSTELGRVPHLALKIATKIDAKAIENVIKRRDSALIIRELFVHRGIERSSELKRVLGNLRPPKFTNPEVEKIVSDQRSGRFDDSFEISARDLELILPRN